MIRLMPTGTVPLWLLTAAVLIGFPVTNFLYWPYVLKAGALPPEADSIGIPIVGSILIAIIASPAILITACLCFRRYNPDTRLLAWRTDRPWRSSVASLLFGVPPALNAGVSLAEIFLALPWYEYLWTAYALLISCWLLALRAAWIEQLSPNE